MTNKTSKKKVGAAILAAALTLSLGAVAFISANAQVADTDSNLVQVENSVENIVDFVEAEDGSITATIEADIDLNAEVPAVEVDLTPITDEELASFEVAVDGNILEFTEAEDGSISMTIAFH